MKIACCKCGHGPRDGWRAWKVQTPGLDGPIVRWFCIDHLRTDLIGAKLWFELKRKHYDLFRTSRPAVGPGAQGEADGQQARSEAQGTSGAWDRPTGRIPAKTQYVSTAPVTLPTLKWLEDWKRREGV